MDRLTIGLLAGSFLFAACRSEDNDGGMLPDATSSRPDATNNGNDATAGGNDASSGNDSGMDAGGGGGMDAGGGTNFTVTTVQNAIMMSMTLRNVELDGVVVIAENHYIDMASGHTVGTFYVQDANASGPAVGVFHGKNDMADYPPGVGAIVTVKGYLVFFDGVLEIESHKNNTTQEMIVLQTTIDMPSGGTVMSGAYPPAGQPTAIAMTTDYAHTNANAHPEQVGNVLAFAGPLTITDPQAVSETQKNDAGTITRGFEVTGGLWVDDTFVYSTCIKPLDGGMINLQNGITGVWNRYQDFYSGSAQNPAPVTPVLYPTQCADLGL